MYTCPHCGMKLNQPSVDQIVALLREDRRRDIYEIGGQPGTFTISYSGGGRLPLFPRQIAEAVAATGIVQESPTCCGYFRRMNP